MSRPTDLKPRDRVRVVFDGVTCFTEVRDLCHRASLQCLDALNESRAVGSCTGLASTFEGHNIQIDLRPPLKDHGTETGLDPAANDIALTVLSDGGGYQARVRTAQMTAASPNRAMAHRSAAVFWVRAAGDCALANHRKFADPDSPAPNVASILAAAVYLADYYAQHITEV